MEREKKEEILREAHERAKASVERKEKSILRTVEEPVLPLLCKIIFFNMIILTAAMLLVDVNAFLRYDFKMGILHLYKNLVITGAGSWGFFSLVLALLSFWGIKQTKTRFWKRRQFGASIEVTQEEQVRCERALKRLNAPFFLYLRTAAVGSVIWGIQFCYWAFFL